MRQPYVILYDHKAARDPSEPRTRSLGPAVQVRPQLAVETMSGADAADAAADPAVQAITPVMPTALIAPLAANATPTPMPAWGLDATGARQSACTGRNVTVAVLDTGIDASHTAFAGVELVQHDFSGNGDGDRQGHGTHCAGTIFGRDVDGERIGVAPGITRALIGKVLGDNGGGNSEMIFQGLQWAMTNGANIISMSLGFDFPGMVKKQIDDGWPAALATSNALEAYRGNLRMSDAIMDMNRARVALGSGALIVAATGNESQRNQNANWRIAASLPAAANDVISVAAAGQAGSGLEVAYFSNSLPVVCGPGVDIVSAKTGGGLQSLSGTSMATPHVAGLAALWWEATAQKGLTPTAKNVQAALIAGATRAPFASRLEVDIGQGLVIAP